MTMAQIGVAPKCGVCRVAPTGEDKDGRDLFIRCSQETGCNVTVDQMGNIFARPNELIGEGQEHLALAV